MTRSQTDKAQRASELLAVTFPRRGVAGLRRAETARDHLAAGWHYTLQIPHDQYRLRLASAWPILMGNRTLDLVRAANPLQPEPPLKISRANVRDILWSTLWRVPFRGPWRRLHGDGE